MTDALKYWVREAGIDGMPLLYNGQEAGHTQRLKFFEKDPLEWKEHPNGQLYRKLFALQPAHTALWNGAWGALMAHVPGVAGIFGFVRRNDRDRVFAVFNFTAEPKVAKFADGPFPGTNADFFSGERMAFCADPTLRLAPWDARVFVPTAR